MVLENTEVLLFMHMGISTCANYAGSTNYYIYRQIFKGVSVEVKEQAQKSCRRDDTASCCGQYQMNSTAFCSRVVLSLDSTLWWSIKFIIHTWLAFYLILVRRSCCNLSTIEIIFFFLIRVTKICLSPWQFCMGSTEIDVFPKHSDPFMLNCSCFLFYLQLKSVKFCEVGKNTCAPVGAILTVLGMFSLPHSILGTGCWLWAKLSAFAN